MPSISFKTFGCKVNQYETQQIREQFLKKGYRESDNGRQSNIYLINTCTVTQKSDREAAHFIRHIIKNNPKSKVIVSGCCLRNKNSEVLKINTAKTQNAAKAQRKIFCDFADISRFGGAISGFKGHNRAFIKIQDGCNNFCSYCIVPLVRGQARSRPLKDIVEEGTNLVKKGFKEIVLSGIHLGAYGIALSQHIDIVDVIESLEKIKSEFRIRLSSLDPQEISQRLIKKLVTSQRLCPHLHIPLQSGDDKILKLMNRGYTRRRYLSLAEKLKKAVPRISITTDTIVGFPGETEKNFQNTIKIVRKINFTRVHIFSYSPRVGTRAYNFPNQVSPSIIHDRFKRLQVEAEKSSRRYRRKFLGKTVEVLVEDKRDQKTNLLTGYSETYIKVLVKGSDKLKNKLVKVKVKNIEKHHTLGELI